MTPNNTKLEATIAATTKNKLEAPEDPPLSAPVKEGAEFEGGKWLRQVHWPSGLVQMLGAVLVGAGELARENDG